MKRSLFPIFAAILILGWPGRSKPEPRGGKAAQEFLELANACVEKGDLESRGIVRRARRDLCGANADFERWLELAAEPKGRLDRRMLTPKGRP